jgi:hypothetical protein
MTYLRLGTVLENKLLVRFIIIIIIIQAYKY